jgi:hypothetical protein
MLSSFLCFRWRQWSWTGNSGVRGGIVACSRSWRAMERRLGSYN